MRRAVLAVLLLGSFLLVASAQPAHDRCLSLLRQAGGQKTYASVHAVDLATGRVLLKWRHEDAMVPASNQKALLASAALLALPSDHRFATDLLRRGKLEGGVLDGDLLLRGEGDPTLRGGGDRPAQVLLARRAARAGIRRVTGDLVLDDSLFGVPAPGPAWPNADPTRKWMARPSALSLDQGTVVVQLAGNRVGEPATLSVEPAGGLRLVNHTSTVASGPGGVWFAWDAEDPLVYAVHGTVAAGVTGQRVQGAVPDPTLVFGHALKHALERAGVRLEGQVRRATDADLPAARGSAVLGRIATPWTRALPPMLARSQNPAAEMIYRHLGAAFAKDGSYEGGGRALRSILERHRVPIEDLVVRDGSGLSRQNRVSARTLTAAMQAVFRTPRGEFLRESMAKPGETGTLRSRLRSLEGRLFAKTGTLNGVSALCGVVETEGKQRICFAILTRGGGGRALANDLVTTMAAGF